TPALHTAGIILLVVGIVTGLWGILLASAQNDIKRLLAYSSIENIGVILIGIGIGAIGLSNGNEVVAACGICGALLHTVNHAFFKSLLFFGAGNVLSQTHTTSLDALGGVGRQMPVTATLFMVATTAICALPPLCGFVSELLIYLGIFSGIATGSEVLLSAAALVGLAMIGGLAILTFTKLYGTVFLGAPRTHCVAEASEVDTRRVVAMAFPLAGILLVGFFPQAAVQIVARAATFMLPNAVTITTLTWGSTLQAVSGMAWLLVAVVGALYLLKSAAQRRRSMRRASTWGCGFTAPNVRMQYTGESFAEGLGSIATLTQNSGEGQAVDKRELFPAEHRFEMRHKDKIDHLFAAWWVELLRQINRPVMRLRTGQVNHYVLFALLFLLLIFLLTTLSLI
ncbi:MAG: proton-conducting transporter membrane subunit, partial [Alistipes sp.]